MTKKQIAEIEQSKAVLDALLMPLELMLKQVNYERSKLFPLGSIVHVQNPGRFVGQGVVSGYPDMPSLLEIRIENQNRWQYPIGTIRPLHDPKVYAPWIKREMCKRRGKHAWKKTA